MKVCNHCHHHFNSQIWTCPACGRTPPLIKGHIAFAPELATASEGFESHFFSNLVQLEAKNFNFWFRSRNRLIIYTLNHYFPKAKSFLEIGCGTGFVLQGIERHFPHLTLSGSEIFSAGLECAAHRLSRTSLFQMDARAIPFVEEFDVIGAFDVLEHIKDDRKVLAQMHQATKVGGGVIFTVPQHSWLWSPSDDYAHHFRRYSASDLHKKVEKAGFRVVRVTSFVSFLLPLMIVSRLLMSRKTLDKYDPVAELKIGQVMNVLFEWILTLERKLIGLGLSFPAGGSLLLVARKV